MGIGSEVYMAVKLGRRGIGVELKPSYYQLAVKTSSRHQNPIRDVRSMTTMAEKMAERDSRWAKVKEMPHFVEKLGFTVHMATEYLELGNRRTASILTDMVKARILTAPHSGRRAGNGVQASATERNVPQVG